MGPEYAVPVTTVEVIAIAFVAGALLLYDLGERVSQQLQKGGGTYEEVAKKESEAEDQVTKGKRKRKQVQDYEQVPLQAQVEVQEKKDDGDGAKRIVKCRERCNVVRVWRLAVQVLRGCCSKRSK